MLKIEDSPSNKVTVSKVKNTTLDYLRIKINDNLLVVDSPGFNLYDKNLLSNKEIKPKTYQMKSGETLLIGERLFNFDKSTSLTIYMENDTMIKKYYKSASFEGELETQDNTDLVIKGEGFINIKKSSLIKYTNLKKEEYEVRESIFGGNYE